MSGTTSSGAFRYPYQFDAIAQEIREKLDQIGAGEDWERLLDDFVALYMDRDRALEDYTTAGQGTILFATVDGNGDGDYTSIKAAIEDVAVYAGGSPQAFSIIYVKPFDNSGNGYAEQGDGNIAMPDTTAIMVWAGGFDGTRSYYSNVGTGQQIWQTDGFDIPSGSDGCLVLSGFQIQLPALKALVNNTTSNPTKPIFIQNCVISAVTANYGLMIPTRFGGDWYFKNSSFKLFNQNGTISTGAGALSSTSITADQCDIAFGPSGIGVTTTLNYSGTATALLQLYISNSRISPPHTVTNTLNLTCSSYSGTGGSNIHISDCLYGLGDLAWNITGMNTHIDGFAGDWKRDTDSPFLQLTITDPIEMSSTGAVGGTGFTLTNCSLPFCWLTITDTDMALDSRTQVIPGSLTGLFSRVTLNCNSLIGHVTMYSTASTTPLLTINGHHNNLMATIRYTPGSGTTKAPAGDYASVINGDNNRLDITAQHWTSICQDNGSNNVVNGGLAGQPLYSSIANARGDLLAAYDADDIRRLVVGSDGQRLTARSTEPLGVKWENPTFFTYDANGDLLIGTGDNTYMRIPVGLTQRLLRADASAAGGVSWDYQRTLNNRLTQNQASLETDTTGWAAESGCTIARNAGQASHGSASLEITKS